MNDFDLRIHLYGDEGNFIFVTMEDGREKTFDKKIPYESFSSDNGTPELIGQKVAEYIRSNCMYKGN